jgi:hypothetical protein
MAELLGSVQARVTPDHGFVVVLGTGFQGAFLPDFAEGRLCYPGDDMLYLMSGVGWAHDDHVVLNAWTGQPPTDPHAEASETTQMLLSQGGVYVSLAMRTAASPILSTGPGGRYHLRVDVTGRTALRAYYANYHPDLEKAVEHLRVSFWPT